MPNIKVEIIGKRVKELREQYGYSQKYLADNCHCTRQRINQIETSDKTGIDEGALNELSILLQCSPDYLKGTVDKPDQICTGYDGIVLTKPFDTGDFRDLLIRKISTTSSNKWPIINTLLDCLKACDDDEAKRFEGICKEFFSYKPQYEECVLKCPDYIYTKIRDEILPNIEMNVYNYLFLYYRENIDSCSLEDSEFKTALLQNLGDFRKECKQKFYLKIQSAVIPNKRPVDSSSSITTINISELVEYILKCVLSEIESQISKNNFKKLFSNKIYSFEEKRSIIKRLRDHMYLRVKRYAKPFVNDLFTFFKK